MTGIRIAHTLFIDIVDYGRASLVEQGRIVRALTDAVVHAIDAYTIADAAPTALDRSAGGAAFCLPRINGFRSDC